MTLPAPGGRPADRVARCARDQHAVAALPRAAVPAALVPMKLPRNQVARRVGSDLKGWSPSRVECMLFPEITLLRGRGPPDIVLCPDGQSCPTVLAG